MGLFNFDNINNTGNIIYLISRNVDIISSLTKGMLPPLPLQYNTLRHHEHTDIFIEVVNLVMAEAMWVHFTTVAVHPSQLWISGYPCAHDMNIIKICCFHQLQIDWQNIILMDLDKNVIKLPALGKILIWATNDLENIQTKHPVPDKSFGRVLDLIQPLEIKDNVHLTRSH